MIQIIPVKERKEDQKDTDKIFYIPNEIKQKKKTLVLDSMAAKYNYAIENIVLKNEDPIICFRHEDAEIRSPMEVCEYKLANAFADKTVGCCGLIGTMALENSCTWWGPNRPLQTAGYIIQGGVRPKLDENGEEIKNENGQVLIEKIEYPMADFPGYHDFMATVDGCCMFFPRWIFEEGLRYDEWLPDFHFYDADICCEVLSIGYKVGINTNIEVFHKSSGEMPPQFNKLRENFYNKWNNRIDQWPISRLTKFKRIENGRII